MRKFFTPLLPKGNRQQEAAPPALLNRYLLSNLNLPYPHIPFSVSEDFK